MVITGSHKMARGFTLVEVMVVTVIFSLMIGVAFKMLSNVTQLQEQQFASNEMQINSKRIFDDLSLYLKKTSLRYVDTRMRVRDGSEFEASDKFPVSYFPDMMQCPNETCPYAWNADNGNADPETSLFSSNYGYYTDAGDILHNASYFGSPASEKGVAHAGKIYNNYYETSDPGQTVCRYDGSVLQEWTTMDVLQFPVPFDVKHEFVVGEGRDEKPDWQGYLIYAPYYNRQRKSLELRRYSIFITDFFYEFPWRNDNVNPLYTGSTDHVSSDVLDPMSEPFVGPRTDASQKSTYNDITINGTKSGFFPDAWGVDPTDNDDKPTLHDLFDFDGDGQIETNTNPGGKNKPVGEASVEWFRLYPSRSLQNAGWSDDHTDNRQVLTFDKYEDDPDRLKGSFKEIELHYYIDLKTGWTRLYYYAEWKNEDLEIDAAFVRSHARTASMPNWLSSKEQEAYQSSPFFVPYKELGSELTGVSFSTSSTYPSDSVDPSGDAGGVSSSTDVKIGLSFDQQVFHRGRTELPNQTYRTSVTPVINR